MTQATNMGNQKMVRLHKALKGVGEGIGWESPKIRASDDHPLSRQNAGDEKVVNVAWRIVLTENSSDVAFKRPTGLPWLGIPIHRQRPCVWGSLIW